MPKSKQNGIFGEISKYPYCSRPDENEDYLSEKICRYTILICKKITRKTKLVFIYGQLIFSLGNGLAPTQAIGLPILLRTPPVIKSIHSNGGLSKKQIIAQVSQDMHGEISFTEREIDQLYHLSIECINNSLSQEELITRLTNLRGGSLVYVAACLGFIGSIIIIIINVNAFQPNPNAIIPPHLQWLYGNQQPGNDFGYGKCAGPRSLTITELTQNRGSDKKQPSSGSLNYVDVMKELGKQRRKTRIEIQVGDQIYMVKNPYYDDAKTLQYELAEKIYDSIRECDTDICDIAANLGFKADNIKNVKDHIFYNEHKLDRYKHLDGTVEYKRFDAALQQALAWKRLEAGTHTPDDITWLKHEFAERHHELKYNSGYSEAHNRAQSRYDGYPWDNNKF